MTQHNANQQLLIKESQAAILDLKDKQSLE